MADCIFCKIIARQIPSTIIAETNSIIVIKDIAPQASIHYLIIPKKHIRDIQSLSPEDYNVAADILFMAQQLSGKLPESQDFRLKLSSGATAGQEVFHLHFHFLAGKLY